MRRESLWIAAGCVLALAGFFPVFSSAASPASREKVIYSFKGIPDGANPLSDLIIDSAGNLYGTTANGGSAGPGCFGATCGTVFELKRSADGWDEEVLYRFAGGKDGGTPKAGLVFDDSGNLYGTTAQGGDAYRDGTVFRLTPNLRGGWTESVIYKFDFYGGSGRNPQSDLIFDAQGNLYGTTPAGATGSCDEGCGAVFKLTPRSDGSWTETTIYSFQGPPGGAVPSSGLTLQSGKFYGVTQQGGTGRCAIFLGCGTAYELAPNSQTGWTETTVHSFLPGGGSAKYPSGGMLFDNTGRLFGTSTAGGDGLGTLFQLLRTDKRGWQEKDIHIFYGDPDGQVPLGKLVTDATAHLYGVTQSDGIFDGFGLVFELEQSTSRWKETILHRFRGSPDGSTPAAGLVFDSQGHLYGSTSAGGSNGFGTVYEIVP